MQLNISSVSPKSVVLALSPLVLLATTLTAGPAQAFRLSVSNISNNNLVNKATGESQLFIDVTDSLGGENGSATSVLFKFSNVGTQASSITQIYIDNSTSLKTMGAITDSDGAGNAVSFSAATGNLNLPSGQNVNFAEDFGLKANTPVSQRGVNPSEWVSVLFTLNPGKTLQSVMTDLRRGDLRLGMHVQAFSNGGSEAFVSKPFQVASTPPPPKKVPEASSAIGLILLAGRFALKQQRRAVVQAD
jgi:hypothetical protein